MVSGVQYTSDCYCFGGHFDCMSASYKIGDEVTLYYNPIRPAQAVVKRGLVAGQLLPFAMILWGAFTIYWF